MGLLDSQFATMGSPLVAGKSDLGRKSTELLVNSQPDFLKKIKNKSYTYRVGYAFTTLLILLTIG